MHTLNQAFPFLTNGYKSSVDLVPGVNKIQCFVMLCTQVNVYIVHTSKPEVAGSIPTVIR